MTTKTRNEHLREWIDYMVLRGLYWTGAAGISNVDPDSPAEDQLSGFCHSFLVALSGCAGAIGPHKLAPKGEPENDLGGKHLDEVMYHDISGLPAAERKLIEDLRELWTQKATMPFPRINVMGDFLFALCRMIAEGYELRRLECDPETGEVTAEGEDLAGPLAEMFPAVWAMRVGARR